MRIALTSFDKNRDSIDPNQWTNQDVEINHSRKQTLDLLIDYDPSKTFLNNIYELRNGVDTPVDIVDIHVRDMLFLALHEREYGKDRYDLDNYACTLSNQNWISFASFRPLLLEADIMKLRLEYVDRTTDEKKNIFITVNLV